MKKTLLTLAISGVMALTLPYSVVAKENAAKPSVEYSQFVTQRQVVDQLLEDALTAFKSPARVSHAGFTAKMPSNMEIVTQRLLEAYRKRSPVPH